MHIRMSDSGIEFSKQSNGFTDSVLVTDTGNDKVPYPEMSRRP